MLQIACVLILSFTAFCLGLIPPEAVFQTVLEALPGTLSLFSLAIGDQFTSRGFQTVLEALPGTSVPLFNGHR